ncbi:serine hydrolase domain-containing protein [Streptomyces sp. NPDC048191]|uniref:serine hydrolase domain-containing protein n=1 Tax=Streptomyces sp. NPDC048191 TaxID=3155484 RepID=UPI0033DED06E
MNQVRTGPSPCPSGFGPPPARPWGCPHRRSGRWPHYVASHTPATTGWRYSNTGYLVAGMLIERVTGHSYGHEIRRRIIEPLHLRRTSVPVDASEIPGPHPRGYARMDKDAPLKDTTALNPTVAGASGAMISSGDDMNRFLSALVSGRLLRPAQLREMMRTRPTGSPDGGAYGLGLESHPLPCGGLAWGTTAESSATRRRARSRSTAGRPRPW